jgi:mRNA interferase RelE/StbE
LITYSVYVLPSAWEEIRALPGDMRQRVRRVIRELKGTPRPSDSKPLEYGYVPYELRRIRLDRWRVIYAIHEDDAVIDIIAVRKRPPYDYGDLSQLLTQLS